MIHCCRMDASVLFVARPAILLVRKFRTIRNVVEAVYDSQIVTLVCRT